MKTPKWKKELQIALKQVEAGEVTFYGSTDEFMTALETNFGKKDGAPAISKEWKAEIRKRCGQIDRGEVELIPEEQVFKEARGALGTDK